MQRLLPLLLKSQESLSILEDAVAVIACQEHVIVQHRLSRFFNSWTLLLDDEVVREGNMGALLISEAQPGHL